MSKSRGNIVRSETILDVLGAGRAALFPAARNRFRPGRLVFSFDALVQRYNADLANDLGNLASRTLTHDHALLRRRSAVSFGQRAHAQPTMRHRSAGAQTITDFQRAV